MAILSFRVKIDAEPATEDDGVLIFPRATKIGRKNHGTEHAQATIRLSICEGNQHLVEQTVEAPTAGLGISASKFRHFTVVLPEAGPAP